jgi:hypothetical protein
MRNDSNWTGRTNRTLHEAFGTHVDRTIWEHYEPVPTGYGVAWWTCIALISIGTAFLLYVGN